MQVHCGARFVIKKGHYFDLTKAFTGKKNFENPSTDKKDVTALIKQLDLITWQATPLVPMFCPRKNLGLHRSLLLQKRIEQ